jgi:hypothetical protein
MHFKFFHFFNKIKIRSQIFNNFRIHNNLCFSSIFRLLGIEENLNNGGDSGRFSMGSSASGIGINGGKKGNCNGSSFPSVIKIEDKSKFKSLGDLHMEKGLPPVVAVQM